MWAPLAGEGHVPAPRLVLSVAPDGPPLHASGESRTPRGGRVGGLGRGRECDRRVSTLSGRRRGVSPGPSSRKTDLTLSYLTVPDPLGRRLALVDPYTPEDLNGPSTPLRR